MIHGDGVISQSEDTVKSTECESKTGFLSSFSKQLVFDLHAGEIEVIGTDKTRETATAISDFKRSAVLLVR